MVKTVLHELVKLRGAAIKGHLSMVPIDMKPQPIILAYIDLNLEVDTDFSHSLCRLKSFWKLIFLFLNYNLTDFGCGKDVNINWAWGPNTLG